jgi:hypothetical protein
MDPITLIFVAFALMTVSYVITSTGTKKADPPKAALLSEFDYPQAFDGKPHIVVFGDCWIEDWQVIWYGDLRTEPIKKSSGGKK